MVGRSPGGVQKTTVLRQPWISILLQIINVIIMWMYLKWQVHRPHWGTLLKIKVLQVVLWLKPQKKKHFKFNFTFNEQFYFTFTLLHIHASIKNHVCTKPGKVVLFYGINQRTIETLLFLGLYWLKLDFLVENGGPNMFSFKWLEEVCMHVCVREPDWDMKPLCHMWVSANILKFFIEETVETKTLRCYIAILYIYIYLAK